MNKVYKMIIRLLFALVIGVFVGTFATKVTTVHAQQATETIIIEEDETALADSADAGTSAMFLLLGGMLLIIITVVITVVATLVVTVPVVSEDIDI